MPPDSPDSLPPSFPYAPVAIVGAGAVGTALGRRLVDAGIPVCAVLNRSQEKAQALARRLDADVAATRPDALPEAARAAFLCVPDDAIAAVARRLAAGGRDWAGTLVAHTSGVHTAAELNALREGGSRALSFHPMHPFTPDTPPDAFEGMVIGIEGDDAAVEAGCTLADRLGARPVALTDASKPLYHAAAALASNGLVALMGAVRRVLAAADIEGDDADALLTPLVEATWRNLQTASPESALTGPAARGDQGTIQAHLTALAAERPGIRPLYTALTAEMTRLAERDGRLDASTARTVRRLLADGSPPAPTES